MARRMRACFAGGLLAATALCLLAAAPARARTSLPSLFAHQIRAINVAPHAPAVLLPRSLPLDGKHFYPTGGPTGSSYDISIGAVAHCNDADACFVADFSAAKAHSVFGKHVKVRGASKAGFLPLSCGASCAPPQIDYLVHGTRYTIQANLRSKNDRATLINAAEAAISGGGGYIRVSQVCRHGQRAVGIALTPIASAAKAHAKSSAPSLLKPKSITGALIILIRSLMDCASTSTV